jgi:hypothetical protein
MGFVIKRGGAFGGEASVDARAADVLFVSGRHSCLNLPVNKRGMATMVLK